MTTTADSDPECPCRSYRFPACSPDPLHCFSPDQTRALRPRGPINKSASKGRRAQDHPPLPARWYLPIAPRTDRRVGIEKLDVSGPSGGRPPPFTRYPQIIPPANLRYRSEQTSEAQLFPPLPAIAEFTCSTELLPEALSITKTRRGCDESTSPSINLRQSILRPSVPQLTITMETEETIGHPWTRWRQARAS
jgi:hypothetical protein